MESKANWYRSRLFQEVVIFLAMFVLTMLHEWIRLDTFTAFLQGLTFFVVLYVQAQLNLQFIFPLLLARRYAWCILSFIASTLLGALLLLVLDYYWISPQLYQEADMSILMSIVYHFALCIISTGTILSMFLLRRYSNELQKRSEVQLKLNEMNLKYLQAQLNPHFFFNMLNNLYGVSLTEPGRAPDLILKLSELMRYQLESGSRPAVPIGEELKFIDNYVAMERERIGKRCEIHCSFPEIDTMPAGCSVAPLILINLVENAFKHSMTISRKWFVDISIRFLNNTLVVEVRNSLPDAVLVQNSTGLGLINIREHLEMLYQYQYSLVCTTEEQEYHAMLKLKLNAIEHG